MSNPMVGAMPPQGGMPPQDPVEQNRNPFNAADAAIMGERMSPDATVADVLKQTYGIDPATTPMRDFLQIMKQKMGSANGAAKMGAIRGGPAGPAGPAGPPPGAGGPPPGGPIGGGPPQMDEILGR